MKVTKTYSIENAIYTAFETLTTEKNINKSSFIEDAIKKFLKENDMYFVDKVYYLRSDPNRTVTVLTQDTTYYFLSDGSKIQKILFMQLYQESDSRPEYFSKNTQIVVDPDKFFSGSTNILQEIGNTIRKEF